MCSWNSQLTYKSQSSGMFCVNKNNMTVVFVVDYLRCLKRYMYVIYKCVMELSTH